jgi:hypothetical protein
VVEFSLSIAAVAFVALMGFHALGAAQATYWGAVQPSFSPPPPANGDFMHPTNVTIPATSSCSQGIAWHIGQQITCTATVTDTYGSNFHTPTGAVNWSVDGSQFGTCPLTTIDAQSSTCTISYQWQPGQQGTHILQATYVSTSNHGTSDLLSPLTFTVIPYQYSFACNNPWQTWSWQVEVGKPLFCTLTVTDPATGLPAPDGLPVQVSAHSGQGHAYFACFTDDDPTKAAQHSAAYTRMTGPPFTVVPPPPQPPVASAPAATGCAPQGGQPFSCTVIPGMNGLCANNNIDYVSQPLFASSNCPAPACSFVYRRNYDAMGSFASSDVLTASAPTLGGESATSNTISIVSSLSTAPTATVIKCGSNVQRTDQISVRSTLINSDTGLLSNNGTSLNVSCTAAIVDIGPNTAFDNSACSWPINLQCDIDAEQPHSPFGQLTLSVYDLYNQLQETYTCNLGHIPPPPANVATLHPLGAWFDSAWCNSYTDQSSHTSATLTFPLGTWTVVPNYTGSSSHEGTGLGGTPPALPLTITVQ